MTVRISGGPSRAPKRAARRGAPRAREENLNESSDEEITSSSSSSSSEEETDRSKGKRLQLDEGLLRQVRKVQQQQQQQQQKQKKKQRLLLLGLGGEKGQQQQQQRKAQQLKLQRQLHAKLIGVRVSTNTALRLANRIPAADVLQLLQQQQQQQKTEAALRTVRKEAARTFVLLRQLQQLLLQQSSLSAAFAAASSDKSTAAAAAAAAAVAEGGWQQRRDKYKQQQATGGEADVWRLLAEGPSANSLRSVCLSNIDAWHQQTFAADFYVELLKASVAAGEGQVEASTLTRETALLTAKRKASGKIVDRRASKGRKIRYKPIPQLESFATAVPWTPDTDALPGADDPLVVEGLMNNLFAAT
ncbi:hypothetical protein, conserved [Eimeria acervulina]|uniref:Apoptosis-antagonizing transcription factor C-terminal domain-containing protein n=1 Tax=Eimeria acervulina TaxID=5801 RepID=U6GS01_EIMAC|nr:hypothetical protein, conserved [Eimeria acervulina]CDI82970.1 hypothetical protein, conserved [Eimeria acervulina]